MTPILRCFIAFSIVLAIPAFGQNATGADRSQADNGQLILKNLLNGKTGPTPNDTCRPDGYHCKSSVDCCGFCYDGVCDHGGGGSSCRPDGAACKSSVDCCGFCYDGTCDHGGGSGSCRPAGLACKSSIDCCNFCHDNVCN